MYNLWSINSPLTHLSSWSSLNTNLMFFLLHVQRKYITSFFSIHKPEKLRSCPALEETYNGTGSLDWTVHTTFPIITFSSFIWGWRSQNLHLTRSMDLPFGLVYFPPEYGPISESRKLWINVLIFLSFCLPWKKNF